MPAHTQARCVGSYSGVNCITTLRFMEIAAQTADKQALAIALRDRWFDGFLTGCSNTLTYHTIEIKCPETNGDTPYALAIAKVGGGSTLSAHQVAIQWNLFSGQAQRRGRGRLFVPAIQSGAIGNGQVASATAVSLDVVMGTMRGRWAAGGSEAYHLGILSRANNAMYAVVDFTYNKVLSTLRSRRLGTGI